MTRDIYVKGKTRVMTAAGTESGVVVGSRRCQMAGCLGLRLIVRWPDGRHTMPCTKGMTQDNHSGNWQIMYVE